MSRPGQIRFLLLLALVNVPAIGYAQLRLHEGARSGGIGEAYAAVSDDVDGASFNPAGLVYSPHRFLVDFGMVNLFGSGLPFANNLSNEGNLTLSSFGIVYNRLRRPNQTVPVLILSRPYGTRPEPPLAPTSNQFSLGVSGSLLRTGLMDQVVVGVFFSKGFFEKSEPLPLANHKPHWLALSLTAKILGIQYDSAIVEHAQVNSQTELAAIRDFFTEFGRSRFDFGLDASAMISIHPRVRLALTWENLIRPNLALQGRLRSPAGKRAGVAVLVNQRMHWLVAADVEKHGAFQSARVFLGTEAGLPPIDPNLFRLRLGANGNWLSTGFSIILPSVFELNYAFLFPAFFRADRPERFFHHRFSLSLTKSPD